MPRITNTLLAALAFATAAGAATAQTKWDLPSAYPTSNFTVANLVQFAGDVDRATGGKLKITVHPNASLFKAPEIKRAVQSGQAQIGDMLPLVFENEWPVYGLDGLPGLATGYADAMRLYQAQKPALQARLNEQGMTLLFAQPWPPHGLFSAKPIDSMADMRGAKWRAYSATTARMADLMGAQPVTVQAAELSQAMATGVVNAFITSAATGMDSKVYEQLKNFHDLQLLIPKTVVIVNTKALQALDEPTRAALLRTAADAEKRAWKVSQEQAESTMRQLAQHGMTVRAPSPKLAGDFAQLGSTLLEDWLKKAGPEGRAIVDAYRKSK
jgi:TRAP-type C4-dicarboxylate transport system substrate-binding protein